MVLLVDLARRAILALLESLGMLAIQVKLVVMEDQEDVSIYQVNHFHLVNVEMQEARYSFLKSN